MMDALPFIRQDAHGHGDTDEDMYDAALAVLLAYATRTPGPLTRLRTMLRRLHDAHVADLEQLPQAYWLWHP
jgi:hypothetical protein